MRREPNYRLKGELIAKFGHLYKAANAMGIPETRLSHYLNGRTHTLPASAWQVLHATFGERAFELVGSDFEPTRD